jgi:hypothetical protein
MVIRASRRPVRAAGPAPARIAASSTREVGGRRGSRYQPGVSALALLLLAGTAQAAGRAAPGFVTHVEFLLSLKPDQPVHGEDGDFALVDGRPTRGLATPLVGGGLGWHFAGFTEVGGRLLLAGADPAARYDDRYRADPAIEGGLNPLSLEAASAANPRIEPYVMADVESDRCCSRPTRSSPRRCTRRSAWSPARTASAASTWSWRPACPAGS